MHMLRLPNVTPSTYIQSERCTVELFPTGIQDLQDCMHLSCRTTSCLHIFAFDWTENLKVEYAGSVPSAQLPFHHSLLSNPERVVNFQQQTLSFFQSQLSLEVHWTVTFQHSRGNIDFPPRSQRSAPKDPVFNIVDMHVASSPPGVSQ